jgi:hypothetical protein
MWIFRKLKLSRQLKSTSSSERFKAAVELAEAGQEMAIPSLASFFEDSENNFLAIVRLKDLAANRGSESAIQAIIRAADARAFCATPDHSHLSEGPSARLLPLCGDIER